MSEPNIAIKSFADLVYEMRQAQKAYFRCRDSRNLRFAKKLESMVDDELKKIRQGDSPEQGALF